jgi:hypothetical protein
MGFFYFILFYFEVRKSYNRGEHANVNVTLSNKNETKEKIEGEKRGKKKKK